MATTQRQLILDAIEATAAGMTLANGYRHTIKTVRRGLKGWADTGSGENPTFEFGAVGPSPWEHEPSSYVRVSMQVTVLVHLNYAELGYEQADRSAAISNMIDDVAKLVNENKNLGDASVDWYINSTETDEASTDATDHRGVCVSAEIKTTVIYHRQAGATT